MVILYIGHNEKVNIFVKLEQKTQVAVTCSCDWSRTPRMDLPSMWAGLSTPAMSSMVGARSMFSTGSARFEPAAKPGPLTKNGTLMSNWGEEERVDD